MKFLSLVLFMGLLLLPADHGWSAPDCTKSTERMSSSDIEYCSRKIVAVTKNIDGWDNLKFGSSLAAVKSIYNDAEISDCPPFDGSCKHLSLAKKVEAFAENWKVSAWLHANTGLSDISLSSVNQQEPLARYNAIKRILTERYGKGVERAFDNEDRYCKAAALKIARGESVRHYEFFSHEKGISYVITARSGKVEVKLSEPPWCPNTPAEILKKLADSIRLNEGDGAAEIFWKRHQRREADSLSIMFTRSFGSSG